MAPETIISSYIHPTKICIQCEGDLRFTDRIFIAWGGQQIASTTVAKECVNGCLGNVDMAG